MVKKIFATEPDLFTCFYQYLATILAKRLKGAPSLSSQRAPTSRNLAKVEDKKAEVKQEEDEFYKLFGLPETEFKIKGKVNESQTKYTSQYFLSIQTKNIQVSQFLKSNKSQIFFWKSTKVKPIVINI